MKRNNFSKKGFSLLDVMFAIGIILVGLVGVLEVFRYVIMVQRLSADRFIAANLAQEGVEIVRAIRDSNWAATPRRPWKTGLDVDGDYKVQAMETASFHNDQLLSYTDEVLKLDGKGQYNYESGTPTKFKRTITIRNDDAKCSATVGDCLSVTVNVQWDNGTRTMIIGDLLYNWQP